MAEVAEWQTRRIQKTLCDEPTVTEELQNKPIADGSQVPSVPVDTAAATLDPATDRVENALAKAIEQAAAAGRFDVVAQLAKELEARRLAHAGNVVQLGGRRPKGGGRS